MAGPACEKICLTPFACPKLVSGENMNYLHHKKWFGIFAVILLAALFIYFSNYVYNNHSRVSPDAVPVSASTSGFRGSANGTAPSQLLTRPSNRISGEMNL